MSAYEREPIGNIIIIKNLIFQNTIKDQKEIDHAWKNGRPCIIIYSDNDYDYVITLTSSHNKEKHSNQHVEITTDDLMFSKSFNKTSNRIKGGAKLQSIYKIPISGHIQINKITFEKYKQIIEKLKEYHNIEDLNIILENAQSIRGRKI